MNMIETAGWLATSIALIGVWLNNRQRRACFVMWLVSNSMTFIIHAVAGMWSLAARDGAFFLLAIHGWWLWAGRLNKKEECCEPSQSPRGGA